MKKTILAVIALFALAGCSKNDEAMSLTADNEVRISSSIATRTSGNDWESGDAIGVYMSTNGGTFADLGSNVLYTTTETSGLGNFTSDNPLYYPGSNVVDFLAYYPYSDASDFDATAYPVDVTSQSDQGAIDLLSVSVTGQTTTTSAVEMMFDHKLSKISLAIAPKEGTSVSAEELEGVKIIIPEISATADFNLRTDEISNLGSATDITFLTSEDGTSAEAILIPQELDGATLTFKTSSRTYSVALSTTEFEAGKEYKYNVEVAGNLVVTISSPTIGSWGNGGDSEDIEATVPIPIDLELIDEVYYINSAEGLQAFADLVNGVENTSANAEGDIEFSTDKQLTINGVLTADVDLGDVEWTPIGSSKNQYQGTFDGGGHLVSGLKVSSGSVVGLFGEIGRSAEIANLGVDGSVSGDNAGGVVGFNGDGNVTNCYNIGSVSGDSYAGGVVGESSGRIVNCYNKGSVSSGYSAGGITATDVAGNITNCYNTGTVEGTTYTGGVVAQSAYSSINNCYYINSITSCTSYGTPMSEDDMKDGGFVTTLNENAVTYNENNTTKPQACAWIATDDYPTLDFDAEPTYTPDIELIGDVYYINAAAGLMEFATLVSEDPSINCMLTNNIDLGGVEWTPIGSWGNPYSGTFDGGGYLVSGLNITYTASYIGFFSCNSGTISNLGVEGSVSGYDNTSGIVGYNSGTVTNCYNKCTVSATYGGGPGGVVGLNDGIIINCYNEGSVSSDSGYVGGVVSNNDLGTVINCYNTGDVNSYYAGGVAGTNGEDGTIINCYNMGTVSGGMEYAGLVVINSGTITNSYWNSDINDKGVCFDSYSDSTTATGMSSTEMQDGSFVTMLNSNAATYNTSATVKACAWVATDEYPTLDFDGVPSE